MHFDPSAARRGLERLWSLGATLGMERGTNHAYLTEVVSDRYALVSGMLLLRDELQFADARAQSDVKSCGADLSVPSVVTTVAFTNCGDRIHQGDAEVYRQAVAARFATMAEVGDLKLESFSPAGGGTDDGATLAHVTVAHQLDEPLRRRVYEGNAQSFALVGIDLKTHVGRLDEGAVTTFGRTRESAWREPRAACGAVVGTLRSYNEETPSTAASAPTSARQTTSGWRGAGSMPRTVPTSPRWSPPRSCACRACCARRRRCAASSTSAASATSPRA